VRRLILTVIGAILAPVAAPAAPLQIVIDDATARAVLKAVQDPALTRDQALAVARLRGSALLIQKLHSYKLPADEAMLADALVTAAHHGPTPPKDG
jgi:hypothetical protein